MEDINEKEHVRKWNKILNRLEDFLYGSNGIVSTAGVDENLNTYIWDMDEVIEILKELYEFQSVQNGLKHDQITILKRLENEFLSISNEENNIAEIYEDIKNIYENIEEY